MTDEMKIKIVKNGPYEVIGGIKISRKEIALSADGTLVLKKTKDYAPENPDHYFLCRCGHSKNMPFCDGGHTDAGFDGTETAGHRTYADRARTMVGADLDLMDDKRCAFARFCHRSRGDVWELTENSDDVKNRQQAIDGITACPSGRLVARDKSGNIIEHKLNPEIEIIQDPIKKCSAGIYVKGGVKIIGADGTEYEIQNRTALCRCGKSGRMPFCDAAHVTVGFNDGDE